MSAEGMVPAWRRCLPTALLAMALNGCAVLESKLCRDAEPAAKATRLAADMLLYYAQLGDLSDRDLDWEHMLLAAEPLSPEVRVRLAMVLDQAGGGDFERALVLLDPVLTSDRAEAVELRPFARLLAGHYRGYQRNAAVADRLGQEIGKLNQQVRGAQMRAEMLQQKLDALAEIERSLPIRPAVTGRQ
ncbi:MAG: hypothetical protein HGA75_09950 [Thiobacillus sp.]|nr:hypothetical protein [Thiobacillus sp.]